jgi:hypothetical protein
LGRKGAEVNRVYKKQVKMTVLDGKTVLSFMFLRKNCKKSKVTVEFLSAMHYNRQGSPKMAGKVADLGQVSGKHPLFALSRY